MFVGLLFSMLSTACAERTAESNARSPAAITPVARACPPLSPPDQPQVAPFQGEASFPEHDATRASAGTESAHPSVTFVDTGGYWEAGSVRGFYRVAVKTYCGEHCREQVLLEQLDESLPERSIRRIVEVPETSPMRLQSVDFWPTGKRNGEIELRLADDDGKQGTLLCLEVAPSEQYVARTGPCHH
jgi:hypothetical protein